MNHALAARDFDETAFAPRGYNRTYYSEVMQDEKLLLGWQATTLHDAITGHLERRGLDRFSHHLEAGSGPTVHHLFALEKYVDEIHVTDYLDRNLREVQAWVARHPDAHDWRPFVRATLAAEGLAVDDHHVRLREDAVRSKITRFGPLDLKAPRGSMPRYSAPFVTSFFVADSASGDRDTFSRMTRSVLGMVAPGGIFVGAYLGGCRRYRVGDRWIGSADVTEADLVEALSSAGPASFEITRLDTPDLAPEGYDHVFAVVATPSEGPAVGHPRRRRPSAAADHEPRGMGEAPQGG